MDRPVNQSDYLRNDRSYPKTSVVSRLTAGRALAEVVAVNISGRAICGTQNRNKSGMPWIYDSIVSGVGAFGRAVATSPTITSVRPPARVLVT